MSDRTISTILIVIFTPLALAFFRWVSKGVAKLIPEGHFKEIITRERGINAKPTLESLRRGLR